MLKNISEVAEAFLDLNSSSVQPFKIDLDYRVEIMQPPANPHIFLIHRELQDMSPSVLRSIQVGYAVQAFNAFHSRNYAKFFAVVRQVDFLQSAILHRYFDTVSM